MVVRSCVRCGGDIGDLAVCPFCGSNQSWGEIRVSKFYNPFEKVTAGESMCMDEYSFLDRVEGLSHKIILVNETRRPLQFYGAAEGVHGFEPDGKSWVRCNEVIIRITEVPEVKKSFWRGMRDLFTFRKGM